MIQTFIKEHLAPKFPLLEWTVDYATGENTGTVYDSGGPKPGQYDVPSRYPSYMVFLSSDDMDYVQYAAYEIVKEVEELSGEDVKVEYSRDGQVYASKWFRIQHIAAIGEPNPLGIENGKMDYSINFETILIEI